jgi:hypothetical protein
MRYFGVVLSVCIFISGCAADSTGNSNSGSNALADAFSQIKHSVQSLKVTRTEENCLFDVRLGALCNPSNLPLCPAADMTRTVDFGKEGQTATWDKCWGRLGAYVGEWENGSLSGYGFRLLPTKPGYLDEFIESQYCDGRPVSNGANFRDDPFGKKAQASGRRYERIDCSKLKNAEEINRDLPLGEILRESTLTPAQRLKQDQEKNNKGFADKNRKGARNLEKMDEAEKCRKNAKSVQEQQECRNIIFND